LTLWQAPNDWDWLPIQELVSPQRRQVKPCDIESDARYVGLEHVVAGRGVYAAVPLADAGVRSAKFRFEAGDILYGKLRPNLRKCVVARDAGVCSTDLVPLRPRDSECAPLIALQMRSRGFAAVVGRLVAGANLPRVSLADLMNLSLPMPRLGERERLVELASQLEVAWRVADELESGLAALQEAIEAEALGMSVGAADSSIAS
jgi:type I restriction enzyme, S subunit